MAQTVKNHKTPQRIWFFLPPELHFRFKSKMAREAKDRREYLSQQKKLTELIEEYVKR